MEHNQRSTSLLSLLVVVTRPRNGRHRLQIYGCHAGAKVVDSMRLDNRGLIKEDGLFRVKRVAMMIMEANLVIVARFCVLQSKSCVCGQ
jgi:hypothetical protein